MRELTAICRLCANTGREQMQQKVIYSLTSSARIIRDSGMSMPRQQRVSSEHYF
jgi:hypothetical protein